MAASVFFFAVMRKLDGAARRDEKRSAVYIECCGHFEQGNNKANTFALRITRKFDFFLESFGHSF